jgi:hypothetical protein
LTPYASHLLGLCFCEHCLAAAAAMGVDGEGVRKFVRQELETFFAGDLERGRDGIDWPGINALASGEMGGYHQMRRQVVTTLILEIRDRWSRSQSPRLELCDFGPLWPLGYDKATAPTGLDLQAAGNAFEAAWPCPYFTASETIATKMAEYREKTPDQWAVRPIMRAIPPQILSADGMRTQMEACDPLGVDGFGFYNYGFMRLTTLDWIRDSLAAVRLA